MPASWLHATRCLAAVAVIAALAAFLACPARAQIMMRESDIVGLRLGQKVLVDDGSCPAGQIKQVSGTKLAGTSVLATKQCVDRKSAKR
jgi:hypothetical protein